MATGNNSGDDKPNGEEEMYIDLPQSMDDVTLSDQLANDATVYSDSDNKFSNADKWAHAKKVLNAEPDTTIFAQVSYEAIYALDDPVKAEATSFVADLRAQYLEKKLEHTFTPELHRMYLLNIQWLVRLREQVRMRYIQKELRAQRLH